MADWPNLVCYTTVKLVQVEHEYDRPLLRRSSVNFDTYTLKIQLLNVKVRLVFPVYCKIRLDSVPSSHYTQRHNLTLLTESCIFPGQIYSI